MLASLLNKAYVISMRLFKRQRFEELKIDEDTIILGMQLGWIEKSFGAYRLTKRGAEELFVYINEQEKRYDS